MSDGVTQDISWLDDLPEKARIALLFEAEAQLALEKLADYRPYPKQIKFITDGATFRERLFRAGNQQGKTLTSGAECAYHLTGEYPEWWPGRRFKKPVVVWAAGETGEATRDNPQRVLLGLPGEEGTGMVPHRCLGGDYGMASGVAGLYDYIKVRHVSGGWSLLRFKYYAQGRRKWQGPPVDVVWFDEEPPPDIYDEGLARTIATGGMGMLSFTPLLGMSEVVRRFLVDPTPERSDTNMTIEDAEHIPAEEKARIIASFPEHEREARARGVPTMGSGLIFPVAESRISCAAFSIPAIWPQLGALDFGWDHPTAAVKLAWDRDQDVVYITAVYRQREATPIIHAAALKPWGERLPWAWPHDGLQHDKGSGYQLAEQYRLQGLQMLAENAKFEERTDDTKVSRTSVEAGLMEMLDRMQTGRLKVFSHLMEWFEEFRLYHRKDGKVVKEYDDIMSATRYGIMQLRYAEVETSGNQHRSRPAPNWRTT